MYLYRKPDAAAKRLVLLHKADGVVRVKSLKKAGLEDPGLNHRDEVGVILLKRVLSRLVPIPHAQALVRELHALPLVVLNLLGALLAQAQQNEPDLHVNDCQEVAGLNHVHCAQDREPLALNPLEGVNLPAEDRGHPPNASNAMHAC